MPDLEYTDLTYLNEVSEGDKVFINEMISIFIKQVPDFITDMERLLKEKEYLELGRLAHKAKSSVIIVGMNELGVKMKELQLLTEKNEGIDQYPEYINDFKSQCNSAMDELKLLL